MDTLDPLLGKGDFAQKQKTPFTGLFKPRSPSRVRLRWGDREHTGSDAEEEEHGPRPRGRIDGWEATAHGVFRSRRAAEQHAGNDAPVALRRADDAKFALRRAHASGRSCAASVAGPGAEQRELPGGVPCCGSSHMHITLRCAFHLLMSNPSTPRRRARQQTIQLSPPPGNDTSQGSLRLQQSSVGSIRSSMPLDTGLRTTESEESDAVLLDMPRGSPAEICVRINPGDRVLGYGRMPSPPAV